MRARMLAGLIAAVCVAVVTALSVSAVQQEKPRFNREHSDLDLKSAAAFSDFTLYYLGESFEDHALTAITRRLDTLRPGEVVRANFVGFLYGDCTPSGDTGCPLPLEVQIWPACERNLSSYSIGPGQPLPHDPVVMRGIPAATFEDGLRLELYTGDVTIVIFGMDREQIERAAQALRPANGLAAQVEQLPPPVEGALDGRLACAS